jgi:glutathione S-transferase
MIVLHHLEVSQSERITWLCEELAVPYELVRHIRAPLAAPESLKSVPGNKLGQSPFIQDTETGVNLSESLAISDYIIYKYAGGRLALKPDHKDFANYLYWYQFSNSTMQANRGTAMFINNAGLPPDNLMKQFANRRLEASLKVMDERLNESKWLAGDEFTAADVMSMYAVTTSRYFGPLLDLGPYQGILRWVKDCSERPAYQRAMEKGDPEMKLLLEAEAPEKSLLELGGITSDIWKK